MSRRQFPVAARAFSRLRSLARRIRALASRRFAIATHRLRALTSRRRLALASQRRFALASKQRFALASRRRLALVSSRRFAMVSTALLALFSLGAIVSRARADSRSYRNDVMKVRALAPPVGWESLPTGSYARLLATWSDKEGGKLTLVAARVPPAATAKSLADESRPALARQGFKSIVETADKAPNSELPRVRLDALLDDGRRFARQIYIVNDKIGYVVTLIGPTPRAPQLRRDFDDTVATLELGAEPRGEDGGVVDVKR